MIQTAARSIFNLSKKHFNNLDQLLAKWEYQLTYRESSFRPRTSRLRLPPLPEKIDPSSKKDPFFTYDQAALADGRLKVKSRFWSLGLRRWLIGWTRRGLFRLRLVGSRLYFKLIER